MRTCSFCRAKHSRCLQFADITLCPECEKAFSTLSAADPRYGWFVAAMKKNLFSFRCKA
ncbi:MAG: hypothetical protein E7335_03730 [Clostridiales bacterium]|nr:hypothetical protein [Clostridiales bacterium]